MDIPIIYRDKSLVVCLKPVGIDAEGSGMPALLSEQLGEESVFCVHRLDKAVGGVMVYALTKHAAAELSRQIGGGSFRKEYLAVIHGEPEELSGTYRDLLDRDPKERKTFVTTKPGKGVQEAILDYEVLSTGNDLSLVKIFLQTGRTHQIRCQFSSRGLPLWGDKKYSTLPDDGPIALWSHCLHFAHPETGEILCFEQNPPEIEPWTSLW